MRAFLAVDLPDEVRERLAPLLRGLDSLNLHGRVVAVDSIHLTLKFLGEIEPTRVPEICGGLEERLAVVSPFRLEVAGLGVFPGIHRPRVVWAGIEQSPPLDALQRQVESSLQALGFPRESRSFRAHLTVARLKSPKNLTRLARFLGAPEARESLSCFPVREVVLFESILRPSGARYVRRAAVALGTDQLP